MGKVLGLMLEWDDTLRIFSLFEDIRLFLVMCAHVYLCTGAQGFQKRLLNSLAGAAIKSGCELTNMGARNQTWIFWKNSLYS